VQQLRQVNGRGIPVAAEFGGGLSLSARAVFIIAPLFLAALAALAATVQVTENRSVVPTTLHTADRNGSPARSAPPVRPARTEETETIDLYGNEVTDAVASYKQDATGALYETHSPQTEVPRLAAPKS
jgi:hypothetical protein